ncbi:hypothetical protein [Neogemmobacter tilapiae]|nr:hypothetical protein [Gemmobacter tilapiae]
MTITEKGLFLAILSMDAYNRDRGAVLARTIPHPQTHSLRLTKP